MSFLDKWAFDAVPNRRNWKWEQHEIDALGRGLAEGLNDRQLAIKLGRGERGIAEQRLKSFGKRYSPDYKLGPWTTERIEELKRLAAEGWSNAWIAEKMGFSRNAIIGKRDRLGLPKLPPGINFTSGCMPHKPRKDGRPGPGQGVQKPQKAKIIPIGVAEPLRIGFMDLRPNHCRWVLDEKLDGLALYCGHEKLGTNSYCAGHWQLTIDRSRRNSRFTFKKDYR